MEERCKYLDMGWGETRPRWWDVNIGALVEVRQDVEGCDTHISTCMGWDGTCMEVGHTSLELVGGNTILDGGETRISAPVWMRDAKWMEARAESCDRDAIDTGETWVDVKIMYITLDSLEIVPGWSWDAIFWELGLAETSHGLRWDTNIRTRNGVRHGLDGGEMWI